MPGARPHVVRGPFLSRLDRPGSALALDEESEAQEEEAFSFSVRPRVPELLGETWVAGLAGPGQQRGGRQPAPRSPDSIPDASGAARGRPCASQGRAPLDPRDDPEWWAAVTQSATHSCLPRTCRSGVQFISNGKQRKPKAGRLRKRLRPLPFLPKGFGLLSTLEGSDRQRGFQHSLFAGSPFPPHSFWLTLRGSVYQMLPPPRLPVNCLPPPFESRSLTIFEVSLLMGAPCVQVLKFDFLLLICCVSFEAPTRQGNRGREGKVSPADTLALPISQARKPSTVKQAEGGDEFAQLDTRPQPSVQGAGSRILSLQAELK